MPKIMVMNYGPFIPSSFLGSTCFRVSCAISFFSFSNTRVDGLGALQFATLLLEECPRNWVRTGVRIVQHPVICYFFGQKIYILRIVVDAVDTEGFSAHPLQQLLWNAVSGAQWCVPFLQRNLILNWAAIICSLKLTKTTRKIQFFFRCKMTTIAIFCSHIIFYFNTNTIRKIQISNKKTKLNILGLNFLSIF